MIIFPLVTGGLLLYYCINRLCKYDNQNILLIVIEKKKCAINEINKNSKIYKCKEHIICPITLENIQYNEYIRELKCKHKFTKIEIDKWLKNNSTCPVCRINVY